MERNDSSIQFCSQEYNVFRSFLLVNEMLHPLSDNELYPRLDTFKVQVPLGDVIPVELKKGLGLSAVKGNPLEAKDKKVSLAESSNRVPL